MIETETDTGDVTAKAHMQPMVIQDVDLNICQGEKKKNCILANNLHRHLHQRQHWECRKGATVHM